MATYSNLSYVNIVDAGAITAPTIGWTNTNANVAELTNIVSNIVKVLKGIYS